MHGCSLALLTSIRPSICQLGGIRPCRVHFSEEELEIVLVRGLINYVGGTKEQLILKIVIASINSWKHHLTWEEVHISILFRELQTCGPHYFSGFGSHLVQYLQYEAMIKTWYRYRVAHSHVICGYTQTTKS